SEPAGGNIVHVPNPLVPANEATVFWACLRERVDRSAGIKRRRPIVRVRGVCAIEPFLHVVMRPIIAPAGAQVEGDVVLRRATEVTVPNIGVQAERSARFKWHSARGPASEQSGEVGTVLNIVVPERSDQLVLRCGLV